MRTGTSGGSGKLPTIDLKRTGQNITRMRKEADISVREMQIMFGFTNPQAIYNWQEICFPGRQYLLKTITKEQIGEGIKSLRISSGYTRKQVADITGIREATLKAYENGDRMLRFDVAYLLAQVYGVSFGDLVTIQTYKIQ